MDNCVGQALMPQRATVKTNLINDIERTEEKLKDLNELKSLLEANPELSRAIDLISSLGLNRY